MSEFNFYKAVDDSRIVFINEATNDVLFSDIPNDSKFLDGYKKYFFEDKLDYLGFYNDLNETNVPKPKEFNAVLIERRNL